MSAKRWRCPANYCRCLRYWLIANLTTPVKPRDGSGRCVVELGTALN